MNANDYDAIAQVAICIELVHKASILLDDYIDGDTARHGIDAFHITHGPERTMIFSLNILCRSLRIINDTFMEYIDDSTYSKISMKLVIQTLEDMTLGVLRELDLSDDASMQKLDDVKEIIVIPFYDLEKIIRKMKRSEKNAELTGFDSLLKSSM